jgi:hypothetical protein
MATTTTPDSGELRLALDDILVGDNVRDVGEPPVDNRTTRIAGFVDRGAASTPSLWLEAAC